MLPNEIQKAPTMFIGLDVVQNGRTSIIGMTASTSPAATNYFSRMSTQKIGDELIKKSKNE